MERIIGTEVQWSQCGNRGARREREIDLINDDNYIYFDDVDHRPVCLIESLWINTDYTTPEILCAHGVQCVCAKCALVCINVIIIIIMIGVTTSGCFCTISLVTWINGTHRHTHIQAQAGNALLQQCLSHAHFVYRTSGSWVVLVYMRYCTISSGSSSRNFAVQLVNTTQSIQSIYSQLKLATKTTRATCSSIGARNCRMTMATCWLLRYISINHVYICSL